MRRYGQFCPVAKAAEVFCQRWTALILRNITWGAHRFSDIQRGVPMMSPTLLSKRLKSLEQEGILERRANGRAVSYHLTLAGREFTPIIEAMGAWGQRWARRDLEEGEIDLDLLLWGIERGARADAFGARGVVRIEFTDQPAHKALWWFLNEDGRCQLCVDDPGGETDLFLAATVADFIRIYRGDIALRTSLADGILEAIGSYEARDALASWLNLGPLSAIRPVNAASGQGRTAARDPVVPASGMDQDRSM
ncbi:helix-turn-helix transcriptional regulator [Defluviimonas sp. WL0024]|uniref:Helix-turn-helix transcriptional regulator n=2 Tax=Albidovulum TaxID=205889 RepID=A0ABT3J9Z0_9RHOB|nr:MULTISPECIES: helix-turn-helix domain-containing protein [Defluviimonas]MCU9850396.1 helix-turn-helix transcriptional regulator [Defluviimonas sp. WL0024]MCW3784517.1 helix-turn-helix transcriptional regulator [Defluviimonas salinarum]